MWAEFKKRRGIDHIMQVDIQWASSFVHVVPVDSSRLSVLPSSALIHLNHTWEHTIHHVRSYFTTKKVPSFLLESFESRFGQPQCPLEHWKVPKTWVGADHDYPESSPRRDISSMQQITLSTLLYITISTATKIRLNMIYSSSYEMMDIWTCRGSGLKCFM